jgi:hypothetical protein
MQDMTPQTPSQGQTQRPSRLLAGIYHDIGMAAVALSLELSVESLDKDAHEAVKRGNRYIYLMPKRPDAAAPTAA